MATKHGLTSSQHGTEQLAKRAKSSATPASRSATPADPGSKVPFSVEYPIMPTSDEVDKVSQKEKDLIDAAEFQASPFKAKGANKENELDQYYTVTPNDEWESMKKYNNFISKTFRL